MRPLMIATTTMPAVRIGRAIALESQKIITAMKVRMRLTTAVKKMIAGVLPLL